ncbi:transposase [Streptococcus pneumoniae]|nr:transposase [Streptococcus pneumoniae]
MNDYRNVQPLMEDFFAWCRRQSVLAGSKLGRAIEYSLKYKETFKTILKDGHLVLSNNLAERAIKSLVMGRSKRVHWTLLLRPITNDLMARSARLLERTRCPSFKMVLKVSLYLRLYSIALPSFEPAKTD